MVEIALQSFRPNGLRMAPIKTSLDEPLDEDQVTNAGKMIRTSLAGDNPSPGSSLRAVSFLFVMDSLRHRI